MLGVGVACGLFPKSKVNFCGPKWIVKGNIGQNKAGLIESFCRSGNAAVARIARINEPEWCLLPVQFQNPSLEHVLHSGGLIIQKKLKHD